MVDWTTKNTPRKQQVLFVKFSSFEFFLLTLFLFLSQIFMDFILIHCQNKITVICDLNKYQSF